MNVYRKLSILATFFGSCIALAFVISAFVTKWWVVAKAKRLPNPDESEGEINLGLFLGDKRLNVKYGWREYPVRVTDLVHNDREFLYYGAWIATIGCLTMSVLFSAISAIFAMLNAATHQYLTLTGVPGLYVWNLLAACFQIFTVILWGVQFGKKLQYNVLSREDLANQWTSNKMACLGFSFWMVFGAIFVHLGNILMIFFGTKKPRRYRSSISLAEIKNRNSILLY